MSEKKIGAFLPFQKRTIHAVKELNFDLEILKDIVNEVDEVYFCIITSFYNGAKHEWYSPYFETIKECHEWAKYKLKEDNWQVSYIK